MSSSPPNSPDGRPPISPSLPRAMVVFGGVAVLGGAWVLGSTRQPTLGTSLLLGGALAALVALEGILDTETLIAFCAYSRRDIDAGFSL